MNTIDDGRLPSGRATPASPQAPAGLGHSGSVPDARPTNNSPSVRAAAVEALAKECLAWGGATPLEDWIDCLNKCRLSDNGYEIAKELDTYHHVYGIDAELVEILDGASSCLWRARDEAVAAWVAENNIKPTLKVGDRIAYREWVGSINGIDEKQGVYLLANDDEPEKYKNGGGIHVAYELAQAIEARSDEPGTGSARQGESAVAESHAPKGQSHV